VLLVHRDRGLKLEVHTREGNPFKMSDLRKVRCRPITASHALSTTALEATQAFVAHRGSLNAIRWLQAHALVVCFWHTVD